MFVKIEDRERGELKAWLSSATYQLPRVGEHIRCQHRLFKVVRIVHDLDVGVDDAVVITTEQVH